MGDSHWGWAGPARDSPFFLYSGAVRDPYVKRMNKKRPVGSIPAGRFGISVNQGFDPSTVILVAGDVEVS